MKKHEKRARRQKREKPLQERYRNILIAEDIERFLEWAKGSDWHEIRRDPDSITISKYDLKEEIRLDGGKYADISRHIFPLIAGFYFCNNHYSDAIYAGEVDIDEEVV